MGKANRSINQQSGFIKKIKSLASVKTFIGFLIFVVFVMIVFTGVFFSYFDINLNTELKTWVETVTYFNNLFSPILLFITTLLIFMTWWVNKVELARLYEQNKKHQEELSYQYNDQKENDYSRATFSAISPKIDTAIKEVYKEENATEICLARGLYTESNGVVLLERATCQTIEDIKDEMRYRAKRFISNGLKYDVDIHYDRNVFVPVCDLEKELINKLYEMARKVLNRERNRKYHPLPKRQADQISHLERCAEETINSLELIELIKEYGLKCKVSFVDYSRIRFGNFEETFVPYAKTLTLQSASFTTAMKSIEYIASLMALLLDGKPEKKILATHIYKTLGRYEIYSFLELTFNNAYSTSEHAPFIQYFRKSFDEIAKILVINEDVNLYGCRLNTKFNDGFVNKIEEIANLITYTNFQPNSE